MVEVGKRLLRAAAIGLCACAPAIAFGATQVLRPLVSGDGGIGDRYGQAIAASSDTLAVAAPFDATLTPAGIETDGVVTLYEIVGSTLAPIGRLHAGDVTAEDAAAFFGASIAIEGDRMVVGAPLRDGGLGDATGAVYVFERIAGSWNPVAVLRSPAPAVGAQFGTSVDLSDGRVYVGAPAVNAVYVFEGGGNTWTAVQSIPGPGGSVTFGYSLAACGDRLVVGDPQAVASGAPGLSGVAHRYDRGAAWAFAGTLVASAPVANAAFGKRVDCADEVFVVGASGDPLGTLVANGRAFVFDLAAASAPLDVLQPLASQAGDGFGGSLAIDGDVIVAGAFGADQGEGAVTFFARNGNDWTEIYSVARNDGLLADSLGADVALVGNLAFAGAPLDRRVEHRAQGSVERFVRDGDDFTSLGTIDRGQGAGDDAFGSAVAISGNTVLVGAPIEATLFGEDQAGTASFYARAGDVFALAQKRESPEPASFDHFGDAVSVAGDLAVVGTPDAIIGANFSQGAAYVFRRTGGAWQFEAKLVATDGLAFDLFGFAVATDGQRIVVGAPGKDGAGENVGAAYVFHKPAATWTGVRLDQSAAGGALVGYSVAIRDDVLAIGAPVDGKQNAPSTGSVFVWARAGEGWTADETLAASPASAGQVFGVSVSIDADAIVAGARGEDIGVLFDAGAAYVFARGPGAYTQRQRIVRAAPVQGERFGTAVSAKDGVLVVGATGAPDGAPNGGAVIRYTRGPGNLYVEGEVLVAENPQTGAAFGASVAVDGPVVAVGEPGRGVENPDEGAVHLFIDPDALFSNGYE